MGLGCLNSMLGEYPTFPGLPGVASTLSSRECLCCNQLVFPFLEIPEGLALRGRALELSLSFNQVGHVVKGAFLAVLLYFFVWPQVTHRITMEQGNISIDGRKEVSGISSPFPKVYGWASFYSGAHLICVSSPSLWMCSGRLAADICFDKNRFPSERSGLAQQKKSVLPTPC